MHTHRTQAATRRFIAPSAPLSRLQKKRVGESHGRFHVHDRAKLSGANTLAKLRHFGVEATIIAKAQRNAGLPGGVDGCLRIALYQRERLLAKYMLAGLCRCNYLARMR